ncbi:uncharacterized protein AMSG_11464 [Thecamonas trahens ATCC 50062]|uniref:Uncharacterized protein n=1 Tax=Thecamonas trahens ATCC 50062 TaxID=461836 RepID=A0A0L0DV82_THETB|nr:hypothetical protein AMSG_11464 [Thecamonas trahens ATCC 50062]KNC56214.1 hypothetical protein AMSG_11464 [Thecamonas trahens ATCC 50062]|eukprot:XP_013752666.1 hypothetical protein AMSG_11464 [Thecamonas trahens ATCC 50062]
MERELVGSGWPSVALVDSGAARTVIGASLAALLLGCARHRVREAVGKQSRSPPSVRLRGAGGRPLVVLGELGVHLGFVDTEGELWSIGSSAVVVDHELVTDVVLGRSELDRVQGAWIRGAAAAEGADAMVWFPNHTGRSPVAFVGSGQSSVEDLQMAVIGKDSGPPACGRRATVFGADTEVSDRKAQYDEAYLAQRIADTRVALREHGVETALGTAGFRSLMEAVCEYPFMFDLRRNGEIQPTAPGLELDIAGFWA